MTKIDTLLIRIRQVIASAIYLFLGIFNLRAQVPVADFTASTTAGCGPLSVHFMDQSSNNPTFWAWDFGNGQISSAQNPNVSYGNPGTYTVTLIVKNSSGAASVVKKDYITVYPFPNPKFTSNLQVGCAPATIQFTDQSTPGQGSIVSWTWNLGDGQISTAQNPSHVYTQTGYYNISLNVTNSGGCSLSTTLNRYIRVISGVQPDFSWSQTSGSCSAPFDITFANQTAGPGTLTYSWDLGNSATSTQTNPSTTYPTNNPYTVKLTATSNLGCSASTSKTISFQGNTPVITAPDNACLNVPVTFQNGSSPAPVSSTWNFGDGTSSSAANPEKTYSTPGTYTVTLTNTYASCSSSATKTITVGAAAPVSFTADKPRGCRVPATVNFTDQTTGSTGWLWDFGDGTTSTQQSPSHTYTTMGNYNVSLNVTTNAGCSNALTKNQYIILGAPAVSVRPAQGCVNNPITLSAGISAPDGVASYLWTAPGATPSTSTSATPTFTYGAEGNYDITFQITTGDGCTASQTFPGVVTVGNKVPAAFTATPTTSCVRRAIVFTSTSPSIDKWLWNFGDGSTSATGPTVTHFYIDTGFNDVMLSVTHHGCVQSALLPKYIYINPPLAGFDFKILCTDRHKVTFTDTSKVDPTKPAATYLWDFGDGTTSTAQNPPQHTFSNLNPQTVKLTVTQGSCPDMVTTVVILQPVNPSFTITPNPVCRNSDFTVASTSTPPAAIYNYTWTVNTGTRTTTNPYFTTSIPDTGAHDIQLVVTDNGGCVYPAVTNTVQITGPTARLAPGGGCKNSLITLKDQSGPYRTDAITSWYLDFGDGNTQNFPSPPLTHTYADTGTYNVTIAVRDTKGCVDTARVTTPVKITSVQAGFFARDTVYCPDAPVPFTDSAKGNNLTYKWDFGDGGAGSTAQNPTHIYTGYTGTGQYYNVKQKITDGAGCSDSVTYNKYIHIQKPIAAFTLDDSAGICTPMATDFTPAGRYYDSLYWNFGDGTTSTLDTVTHFYNNYGPAANNYAYVAKLVLQGAGGCRDSAMRNVYVYQPYTATSLTFSPTSHCDSLTANFAVTPPRYINFKLSFGDGAVDSSGNTTLSHTYTYLGTYAPQVVLQDTSGCIVGVNRGSITVLGSVPIFTVDKKNLCDEGTVNFQGLIISNDGQSVLTWDFADGTPPLSTPTPTGHPNDPFLAQPHFYSQPGVRLATLKVTTNSGCNESYTDTIHIWQTPHPLISADGPLCAGPIQFHGNVTIPNIDSVAYAWTFSNGANSSSKDPFPQLPSGPLTAKLTTSVAFGCSDNTSQTVNIFPLPEIKGPRVLTTPVGIPVTLPFTYSSNVSTYTWSPSTYLDCTDCPTPVSTPVFNTTYTVTVTDENQCTSTDTVLVKTICGGDNYFIPNTFSPNNDGVNDVFYPRGKGLHDIQSMRIFNRWGQLVFERKNFPANSASMGWDGTINGRPAPSDAYVYIIEVICINAQIVALKGDVTLIR